LNDLAEDIGGRGLFLVAGLSSRWDWYRTLEPFELGVRRIPVMA
jgi:hypothetical protein